MDVYTYAALCEASFESQYEANGHERLTTFYSDLSIAEFCGGKKSVNSTYRNVCENWFDSKEFFTEFAVCLNWKSWEWDARRGETEEGTPEYDHACEMVELYASLWEKARNRVYRKWDEEGQTYFFEMTD